MKLSIIPADKTVYVDGWSFSNLDLSFIPEDVHALQWKNDLGWIEFTEVIENGSFIKPQNEVINELPDWANTAVTRWNTAKEAYEEQQRQLASNTSSQTI
jgi:hypothetical protein